MSDAQFEAKVKYCQAYQLEEQAYRIANERNAFDSTSYIDERKRLTDIREEAMTEFVEAGGVIFDRMVQGCTTDGTSHYEIDDALRVEFGDRVAPDSESSQLYIYISSVDEKKILRFLSDKFPSLKWHAGDICDQQFPGIGNWPQSREFLKAHGIEPETKDYSYIIPVRSEEEIAELVGEAVDILGQTGLNHAQVMRRIIVEWHERKLPRTKTLEDFFEAQEK